MSGETTTTIVGQLTDDPVLRHTAGGDVTSFTVASTPRTLDRTTGEWEPDPVSRTRTVW